MAYLSWVSLPPLNVFYHDTPDRIDYVCGAACSTSSKSGHTVDIKEQLVGVDKLASMHVWVCSALQAAVVKGIATSCGAY